MFIKMSTWMAKAYDDVRDAADDAQCHVDNGNIVAFGDDFGCFVDEMGINESDIQVVEPE